MPPPDSWGSPADEHCEGLRPSALSLGLTETIEECMKPESSDLELDLEDKKGKDIVTNYYDAMWALEMKYFVNTTKLSLYCFTMLSLTLLKRKRVENAKSKYL